MPSLLHVAAGSLVALFAWTALGWPFARRLFGTARALPLAPALGWAMHNVVAVLVFRVVPFGAAAVVAVAAAIACVGALVAASLKPSEPDGADAAAVPPVAWLAAALLAAACTAAVLPKEVPGGIALAAQVFDHAKVAMIDDMVRLGLPPGNPFIAPERAGDGLAYYYLWHFSAAQLATVVRASGWEADAAMTFFATFASLAAAMGVAVHGARRSGAALLVVLVAAASSSRPVWLAVFGAPAVDGLVRPPGGFGGWMFQSAWVPQHVAATTCVVLALLAIERLARRVTAGGIAAVALCCAAAFESSTWIGGVVLAFVCAFVVPWLALQVPRARRGRVVGAVVVAAVGALALAWPFVVAQVVGAATRHAGSPVVLRPWPVLGAAVPGDLRPWLDWPAFFGLMLPIEWTAAFGFGLFAVVATLRRGRDDRDGGLATLAVATLATLVAASLLVSTLADNNDLGWRAALLASTLLIPFAAIAMSNALAAGRWPVVALAAVALGLGAPEAVSEIERNVAGRSTPAAAGLAAAPALWRAVRAHTAPDERVANDPNALARATPWPVNIGWSLFADRRSCYAAWELVQVYSSIPHDRLRAIDRRFVRVFAGDGSADDVHALATLHDCRVVVLTPDDGAWRRDPFARSPDFRLVDDAPGWRLYRRRDG